MTLPTGPHPSAGGATVTRASTRDLSVSLAALFGDDPVDARFARAAAAGFRAVETWWPWDSVEPSDSEIETFAEAALDANVDIVLLNTHEGPARFGGLGLASAPAACDLFRANARRVLDVVRRCSIPNVHVLAGAREAGTTELDALAHVRANLEWLLDTARDLDCRFLLEPLDPVARPGCLLADLASTVAFVRELRRDVDDRIALLADARHIVATGLPLADTLVATADVIGHVQLAEPPARRPPRPDSIALYDAVQRLIDAGYSGTIGLEYLPDAACDPATVRRTVEDGLARAQERAARLVLTHSGTPTPTTRGA